MQTNNIGNFQISYPETVEFDPEDIFQASQQIDDRLPEAYRWATYIRHLARIAVDEWISPRLRGLSYSQQSCSLLQFPLSHVLEAICNLKVGDFNVCVLAIESVLSGEVVIPRAAVELPEFRPDIYFLVEVKEAQEDYMDAEFAVMRGVVSADKLCQYLSDFEIQPLSNWTYEVPLALFGNEPGCLMTYARHLEPATIRQAVSVTEICRKQSHEPGVSLDTVIDIKEPLWQQLNWDGGAALLRSQERLQKLYEQPKYEQSKKVIVESAALKVLNIMGWLQGKLDEPSRQLGFWLGEALSSEPALMTDAGPLRCSELMLDISSEVFRQGLRSLREQGVSIPSLVLPIYYQTEFQELQLRFCFVFPLSKEDTEKQHLLIILRAEDDEDLPMGLIFKAETDSGILQQYELDMDESVVFLRLSVSIGEAFRFSVKHPNGSYHALPTLTL
ncbi:DUF1822 family protein [Adonisia turfae]|uniref:DUF1822 family protein n=1 Tax=Adonisia turfae CCMR0081 TaxID=2292702 RepID=A0A6M0RR24_9CYAN|nr:DUF1822 family protein [Adonisia turfae]NEZ58704.1 DUF1822 family protein [Adonisia turfae CCMR0081]